MAMAMAIPVLMPVTVILMLMAGTGNLSFIVELLRDSK